MLVGNLTHSRPKTDLKQYHLLDVEGLTVLLISTAKTKGDAENKKAAAAMSVEVGSFSDPSALPGLAHYLEHMLFMGSDKYPVENEYDDFVSSNGGYCNACTEGEMTQFTFEMPMQHYFECLDIFAECFKSPLLSKESSTKEVNAIDNEYHEAKMDDDCRLSEIFGSDALDGHFLRKFCWGNKESLALVPEQNGIDVSKELRNFYLRHYYPQNCKLVMLAPFPLEEMIEQVAKIFSGWNSQVLSECMDSSVDVESKEDILKATSPFSKVFGDNYSPGSFYQVIPLKKNYHWLNVAWVLDPTIHLFRCKSVDYLSHLIGHEGEGSILALLKSKGLASEIVAGVSDDDGSCCNTSFSVFTVGIYLTVKGVVNWMEVVRVVYAYLRLLKTNGAERWIFDELKHLAHLEYDYQDEDESDEFAERLSAQMTGRYGRLPPRDELQTLLSEEKLDCDLLSSSFLYFEYCPNTISRLVESLLSGSVKVMLSSSLYVNKEEDSEEYEGSSTESDADESEDEHSDDEHSDDDDDDDDGDDDDELPDVDEETLRNLYEGPDSELFRKLALPPFISNVIEGPCVEPHFGGKYYKHALSSVDLDTLRENSPDDNSLKLPSPNPFIPHDFSMISSGEKMAPASPEATKKETPSVVYREHNISLWHFTDCEFGLPKVWIHLKLAIPPLKQPEDRLTSAVMNDLFCNLMADMLTETCYMADLAHTKASFWSGNNDVVCVHIRIRGFSDSAMGLLERIFSEIERFCSLSSSSPDLLSRLSRQLELLTNYYSNAKFSAADSTRESRLNFLYLHRVPMEDRLAAVQALKPTPVLVEEVQGFVRQLLGLGSVMSLVQGNISMSSAQCIGEKCASFLGPFQESLDGRNCDISSHHDIRVVASGVTKMKSVPSNVHEVNCAIEFYFQFGKSSLAQSELTLEELVFIDMFDQIITEPFFDALRTNQQTGYDVSSRISTTGNTVGYVFKIVSKSHSISQLSTAITNFLKDEAMEILKNMPLEKKKSHANALLSNYLSPYLDLNDKAKDFWHEINVSRHMFFLEEDKAKYLQGSLVNEEKVLEFFNNLRSFCCRNVFCFDSSRLFIISSSHC